MTVVTQLGTGINQYQFASLKLVVVAQIMNYARPATAGNNRRKAIIFCPAQSVAAGNISFYLKLIFIAAEFPGRLIEFSVSIVISIAR